MLRPVVSTRFQVLFHSPQRGSFHLSFTVLVHYRLSNVFSLGRWPSQIPTRFLVSRRTQVLCLLSSCFVYGAVTLYGLPFQKGSTTRISHSAEPYNPTTEVVVWAFPFSLATTQGIVSFPRVNEMFQFTLFPSTAYFIQLLIHSSRRVGFPIRTSSDIMLVHNSPRLFAVYHVLLRHLTPRHPSCALSSLFHMIRRI